MMSRNKFLLPLIILFLLLTFPLGIYGILNRQSDGGTPNNPNHLHKYEGKLFYYKDSKIIGVYTCNSDDCDDVDAITTDEYLKIDSSDDNKVGMLNDYFALVKENNVVKMVSLINGMTIKEFSEVKNYGDNQLPYLVLKNENGYLAINRSTSAVITPHEYEYVGYLFNDKVSNILSVKNNNKYYLISSDSISEEKKLSSELNNPIYFYTDRYIVTINSDRYNIYDYEGNNIVSGIDKLDIIENNIIVKTNNGKVYYYDINSEDKTYEEEGSYDYEINDKLIKIIKDENEFENIDIR